MLKILLATGNAHKAQELLKILPRVTDTGKAIDYLTFADFPNIPEPVEDAPTLKENAIIKALCGFKSTGLISIADDTGLMVDALGGRPGVHSARYAFADRADYPANNQKLLEELKNIPQEKRTANFTTVAALILPDGEIITKEGRVEGFIAQDYSGSNGFGYDPLFIVKECGKTMAEMTTEEKNKISHRARAFTQMAQVIKGL